MPRCSVIGCGTDRRKMPPDITLHHLPKMEEKRNAWLEILGVENTYRHCKICISLIVHNILKIPVLTDQ